MTRWMSLAFLGLLSFAAFAQSGYYEQLRWRSNDPFVFCRYGLRQTPRAWFPSGVPNYAYGPPMPTPGYCPYPLQVCPYPFTALRGWSVDEINAYYTYLRVCPQARDSGRWEGSGNGTTSPSSH